jgi:hypothetical protein
MKVFTFTIHIPALMLRAMQTVHLAVRTIGTSTETKTITRAVVMIQSC